MTGSDASGIDLLAGASATIDENIISGHDELGVSVYQGAFARINGNEISGNGNCGIAVGGSATARGNDNTIIGNDFCGVGVFQHSSYRSNGDTIEQEDGLYKYAVEVARHSYADIRNFTATGAIEVNKASVLYLKGTGGKTATVNGDIDVLNLSMVIIPAKVDLNGTYLPTCDKTSVCVCNPWAVPTPIVCIQEE